MEYRVKWLVVEAWFPEVCYEPCLYFKHDDKMIILVLVHVDDVLCATNDAILSQKLFEYLDDEYGLKDQGDLSEYLGVEVMHSDKEIVISQRNYA